MSANAKQRIAGIVTLAVIVGFLTTVKWTADPRPSAAFQTQPSPPAVSVVFVIDSSRSMFPATGPNYFDLATDGIVEFLKPRRPTNVVYEYSVIQYTKLDAREYIAWNGTIGHRAHWIPPTVVRTGAERAALIDAISNLQPSGHSSSILLETGIREATRLLTAEEYTNGTEETSRQIVLLTTGEYRIPLPCPGDCYTKPDVSYSWPDGCNALKATIGIRPEGWCNRACFIRDLAQRASEDNQIHLSALHLGYDWKNLNPRYLDEAEAEHPYGPDDDYCNQSPAPVQPDRGGLLQEITCVDGKPGRYVRINPFVCFPSATQTCDPGTFQAGTARDIARQTSMMLCEAQYNGGQMEGHADNPDGDYFGGDLTRPILSVCDNCPNEWNQRQRDCNQDDIGDTCQFGTTDCGQSTVPEADDLDGDGVCNLMDICDGGDDCLVAAWTRNLDCSEYTNLGDCGLDCDHDEQADPCQAAIEIAANTLPFFEHDQAPLDGEPDCCQNKTCDCDPIPAACDLDSMENANYFEDFSTFEPGEFATQPGGQRGWWQDPNSSPGAIRIVDGPAGGPSDDPSDGKALELALDPSLDNTGAGAYFIEGPGIQLPALSCARALLDQVGTRFPSPLSGFVDMRPWGTVAIDLQLYVGNGNGGPDFDLYILDTEIDDWEASQRVHLRFVGNPGASGGIVYSKAGESGYNTDLGLYKLDTYSSDSWLDLTIVIDSSDHYTDTSNTTCGWYPRYNAVRIHAVANSSDPVVDSTVAELGSMFMFRQRGVQLHIASNNREGSGQQNVLRLAKVRIRTSDPCEMNVCSSPTGPKPCRCDKVWVEEEQTEVNGVCAVGGEHVNRQWECHKSLCTDGYIDSRTEECETIREECCEVSVDLCNVAACACNSENCQWKCGDEVVSGDEECDPPGLAGCDANCKCVCGDGLLCGPEVCDDENTLPQDGCEADCRSRCGDGVVQSGEQCDGEADCSSHCTWIDGLH